MRPLRVLLRLLFFSLLGISITIQLFMYFFHTYFVPPGWLGYSLLIGIPLGLLIGAAPWGRYRWRAYLLGGYLIAVHLVFAVHSYLRYGGDPDPMGNPWGWRAFADLTLLNYTEQLNLQAWYFFGFWILSFFVFQPWNWGWARSVQLGEEDPYRVSSVGEAHSPEGGAAGQESAPHGEQAETTGSGREGGSSLPQL